MTYATQQDLIDRFGEEEITQLTDRQNLGAIDAAVVARALADADAEINPYLASRYTLPFASAPAILVRLGSDIARYFLFDDKATEQVTQRYKDAIAFLKSVANGTATLGVDAAIAVIATSGGPTIDAADRVFTTGRPSTGTEGTLDDYLG